MAADNPRVEDLRRRIQQDPASIAFAQLAEEHRRAGDYDEAVRVCRAGLQQHPFYVSAHVTLARALMELGQLDEAQAEFEHVLLAAPDNLIAVRSMAELHQRRGEAPADAAPPAAVEPPLAIVAEAPPPADGAPSSESMMNFDAAVAEFNTAFGVPLDPALEGLERWLAAIVAEREAREGPGGSDPRHPPHS